MSSRGICVWDGRVFVTSGYHHQMLVVDLHTCEVLDIRRNICGDSPMEWACTDHPTRHAVSDKKGNLRFGSFADGEFPELVKLDDGNIHRVRYDARHDRFWATQDFGSGENADIANGIVVGMSGEKVDECLFARDDVEFVTFSPDHLRAYAGGFDGELHIFDNSSPRLRIMRTVSGFPHQLSDLTVGPDGEVYVLCQDGEILRLDAGGRFLGAAGFRRQVVWDVQPSPDDPRTLYCATDGGVAVVAVRESVAGPMLQVKDEHPTGFGFTRRVAPLRDGWLGITRDHRVFRSGRDGVLRWSGGLPALPHTISAAPDGGRALVATNAGAVELDTADGHRLELFDVDGLPVWAAAYLPDGDRLLVTRNGLIVLLDGEDGRPRWRFDQSEYPKRLWFQEGRAYVTGDGGVKELVVGQGVVCRWSKLLSNTVENAAVSDDLVCASSYGMQLAAYDRGSGELLGLLEDLPDYPKALTMIHDAAGTPHLLVGCRTGLPPSPTCPSGRTANGSRAAPTTGPCWCGTPATRRVRRRWHGCGTGGWSTARRGTLPTRRCWRRRRRTRRWPCGGSPRMAGTAWSACWPGTPTTSTRWPGCRTGGAWCASPRTAGRCRGTRAPAR